MTTHLRPGVTVHQVFVPENAVIRDVPISVCLIGPHYQIEEEVLAGAYIGGMSDQSFGYPDLVVGAVVVQADDDDNFRTAPLIMLNTIYGTVDITSQCTFNTISDTFTIPQSITVLIDAVISSAGILSSLSLTDTTVNYLTAGIAAADTVYIGGMHYFTVASVDGEHALTLTRVNKLTTVALDASLGAPDVNGNILVTLAVGSVPTGLAVAALRCGVSDVNVIYAERGINVTTATLDIRTLTAYTDLVGSGIYPDSASKRAYVWCIDGDGDWVPQFKIISYTGAKTLRVEDGDFAVIPATALNNVAFSIINYDDTTVTGTGTYSSVGGTLTDVLADFVVDGVTTDDVVVDANGQPILTITNVAATILTVLEIKTGTPPDGAVPYTISTPTTKITQQGLEVVAANKTIVAQTPGLDFEAIGIAVGDYIRSGDFSMYLKIIEITDATHIEAEDPDTGMAPAVSDSHKTFCFVSATTYKDLLYVNRESAASFTVRDTAGLLEDMAYDRVTVEVTYPASASTLAYVIKKTITGVDVAGSVYISYMARRFDYGTEKITLSRDAYLNLAGPVHPANPMGLAAHIVAQQTSTVFYGIQVEDDSMEAWAASLTYSEIDKAYGIVPLSASSSVIGQTIAHVLTSSAAVRKLERCAWTSKVIERQTIRVAGSGGNYNNVGGVITVAITGTLKTTHGVASGDEITLVLADDTVVISNVVSIVESGGASTLTLVYSATPPAGFQLITTYSILSPEKSDADYAAMFAAYTASIAKHRVRNIFPMYAGVELTNTAGVKTEYTVGGYYLCAMEAAKRAETAPKLPLTRIPGYGFNSLIKPFGSSKTLIDILIDSGNYVVDQDIVGGPVYAIRSLTTDVSETKKYDEAVTVQVDSFAKRIRVALAEITATSALDTAFIERVALIFESERRYCMTNDIIRDAYLISVTEDPDRADGYILHIKLTPFYGAATGTVYVYV